MCIPGAVVQVNLWGLDAIKTKGESVAIVLHLVGARPLREATGRVARYELIPLQASLQSCMTHISPFAVYVQTSSQQAKESSGFQCECGRDSVRHDSL